MQTLPSEFIAYWQKTVAAFMGNTTRARRWLIEVFHKGAVIPGYGTRIEWLAQLPAAVRVNAVRDSRLPRGWSLANLTRIRPSRAARLIATNGGAGITPLSLSVEDR